MSSSAVRVLATRVLVLGGSSEATALATALAGKAAIDATLSLAGRTSSPLVQALPTRIGGFGGIDGLAAYLVAEKIDILVDATHPFAAQISRHAREAAVRAGCRLIAVGRPPWRPLPGDAWREVADIDAAVDALGPAPRRAFLTVGRLQLAAFAARPQHHYLVRTIDAVGPDLLPGAEFIAARGPFDVADEERLIRDHRIEVLVTKNSGGAATAGKLEAARRLGLSVILVRRPQAAGPMIGVGDALGAIEAHRAAALRGV